MEVVGKIGETPTGAQMATKSIVINSVKIQKG